MCTESETGLIFDGTIPWVTGAEHAQHVLIGATLKTASRCSPYCRRTCPASPSRCEELMALQGSITAEVRCNNVSVDRHWLLAGPTERHGSGRGGTGGLETSCLALGLADAALRYLESEAAARQELKASSSELRRQHSELSQMMFSLAHPGGAADDVMNLRGRANSLVLGATQAALTAAKGTGFLYSTRHNAGPARRCSSSFGPVPGRRPPRHWPSSRRSLSRLVSREW